MPRTRDHDLLRELGKRLARARQDRGWTQERLAEAVGLEPVSLSRLETGDRALSISTLAAVAGALGIGLGDLLDVERELPAVEHAPEAAEALRLLDRLDPDRRDLVVRLMRELATPTPTTAAQEPPQQSTPAPRKPRTPGRRAR